MQLIPATAAHSDLHQALLSQTVGLSSHPTHPEGPQFHNQPLPWSGGITSQEMDRGARKHERLLTSAEAKAGTCCPLSSSCSVCKLEIQIGLWWVEEGPEILPQASLNKDTGPKALSAGHMWDRTMPRTRGFHSHELPGLHDVPVEAREGPVF